MSLISEFKAFAMRGNVVDLAVAVVIGTAFGKIVTSLVDGIIMPIIGLLVGGVNFSDRAIVIKDAVLGPDGTETAAAVLFKYGAFLQTVLDFVIIAFAIFLLVKLMNRLKRKQDAEPAKPAELSTEAKLLTEIRDSLQARAVEPRQP